MRPSYQRLLVQENHYDPFGLNLAGIEQQGTPDHLYQFGGKEKQPEHGLHWQDFGARNYDAQTGRWHSPDPLDQYASPYVYCGNNPTNFTDPTGMKAIVKVPTHKINNK
jgi:RHS repeat-associated protein